MNPYKKNFYRDAQLYFPEEVYQEARELVAKIDNSHFDGKKNVFGTAVDMSVTKKRSDILDVQRDGDDFVVSVSVPDAASVIPPESLVDKEARLRVKTRYDGGMAPMLPRHIGEGALNFREDQRTPALTITMRVDGEGTLKNISIEETVVENPRCISYTDANLQISSDEMLREAHVLAERFFTKRLISGALAGADVDHFIKKPQRTDLLHVQEQYSPSFRMIREFMLLTNMALAQWLHIQGESAIYVNCHRETGCPDIDEISRVIRAGLEDQQVLMKLKFVQFPSWFSQISRSTRPTGHDQLQLPAYLRATSPLSQYEGLVIQRIIKSVLHGTTRPYTEDELAVICENINKFYNKWKPERGSAKKPFHTKIEELQEMTPELQAEILDQLQSNRMQIKTLCLLLIKATINDALWGLIIQKIFEIIETRKDVLCMFFDVAIKIKPKMFGVYTHVCELKNGVWMARSVVIFNGRPCTTPVMNSAETKKAATIKATFAWWKDFVEKKLVFLDEAAAPIADENSIRHLKL